MKFVIKLSTGKEIELTAYELKELFDQTKIHSKEGPAQPYQPPVYPYSPVYYGPCYQPYIVTC